MHAFHLYLDVMWDSWLVPDCCVITLQEHARQIREWWISSSW